MPLRAPGFFSCMGDESACGLVVCKLTAKKTERNFIWGRSFYYLWIRRRHDSSGMNKNFGMRLDSCVALAK